MRTICCDLTEDQVEALREEGRLIGGLMLPLRMAKRITIDPATGCWRTSGHCNGKGHKKIKILGKDRQFHRVSYQVIKGPIPPGKVLDHVKEKGCVNRDCSNPDHLEPVTTATNTYRGRAVLYSRS